MLLFRCDRCHTAVWLSQDHSISVDCSHCSQRYEIPHQLRGQSMEQLHRQARGLARELNIDLPSAVSMMFGVLRLPQVQDFLSGDSVEESPESVAPAAPRAEIDPAFEESISAGRLSRLEALHRGDREQYTKQLIERHGISLEEAYAVADNREALLAIVRRRKAQQPRTIVTPAGPRLSFKVAVAAVGVCGLIAWGIAREIQRAADMSIAKEAIRSAEDRRTRETFASLAAATRPTAEPAPELSYDPGGQVTRISAPRPEAVLRAHCRTPELQPIALATGAIPDKNLWFGVFVDVNDSGRTKAVVIRKERSSGHWVAGDGSGRIQILTPDPSRLGTLQMLDEAPAPFSAAESR